MYQSITRDAVSRQDGNRVHEHRLRLIVSCLLGIGAGITLPFGGNLFVGEILLPIAALWAALNRPSFVLVRPKVGMVVALMVAAAAVMIAHDILSAHPADPKVWVRLIAVPVLIMSAAILHDRRMLNIGAFAIFNVVGISIAILIRQDYLIFDDLMRYNLGPWVAWATLVCIDRVRQKWLAWSACSVLMVTLVFLGLRSVALVVLVSLVLAVALEAVKGLRPSYRMLGVVVGLLLVFSVAWPAFNYAALSGYLGEAVREKQLWQTSSREGFLATARPHTRFELEAISDAPFVGSGSIPQNAEVTGDLLHAAAIDVRDYLLRQLNREDIQTHSFIFDNWIRAGILGGLSWFVVSIVIVRSMFLTIWYGNFPGYACSYLMFLLAWNIFFSPMAPQARLFTAISIVVVFSLDAALLSARRDARRAL